MRSIYCFILIFTFTFSNLITFSQEALPPLNVYVDDLLTAHWSPPAKILLDENFEGTGIPAGWQLSSQGQGWSLASSAQIGLINVPSYSQFFISNDGAAPAGNNGCCDYLITPTLNLSQYSGYHLSFLSFFTGNYGQLARLEISTDNGATWNLLQSISPDPTWRSLYIDLSAYSGPGGYSTVKLAFHADDQGNQASGWAVDDVQLKSASLAVQEYQVELNGVIAGNTTETSFQFNPANYNPINDYMCCVTAIYPTLGMSPADCDSFPEFCEAPPQNLAETIIGDSIVFTWSSMSAFSYFDHFHIYLINDYDPISTTDTSITLFSPPGQLCINITAVYDLTILGFPGLFSESYITTGCGLMDGGFAPPFNEDWSSGQFNLNKWEAGSNWSIDNQAGNPAPSVQFTPSPGKSAYESTLISWYMDASSITECSSGGLDLDFDLRLEDPSASETEYLNVQLSTGDTIYTIAEYTNSGSFDWQTINKHIIQLVRGKTFRILFNAGGMNTGGQVHWFVDNIQMHFVFYDPVNGFDITVQRVGAPENDILLRWKPYPANNLPMEYMMDDGSAEEQQGLGAAGEVWLGNQFSLTDAGILHHASVFMSGIPGATGTYTLDIFDAGNTLLGSSEPFIPIAESWTNVNLPDIPFNGTFFAMLHIQTNGVSDKIGIDTNGPNATADFAWHFDGVTWTKITDQGMPAGVFLLRIKGLVTGNDKMLPVLSENYPVRSSTITSKSEKVKLQDVRTQYQPTATVSDCDTVGYDIYRRAYSSYPPGSSTGTGEWEWIGCTPKDVPQFLDINLDNTLTNCYEYSIGIIYPEGHSLPGGSAWDCIYVGLPEYEQGKISTYPNPADQWVRIDLDKKYEQVIITGISGTLTATVDLAGKPSATLNTSHYVSGIYLIKFIESDGSCVTRKLLVRH